MLFLGTIYNTTIHICYSVVGILEISLPFVGKLLKLKTYYVVHYLGSFITLILNFNICKSILITPQLLSKALESYCVDLYVVFILPVSVYPILVFI